MVLVKDQFGDFEELKVLTPVREEASNLLLTLIPALPPGEVEALTSSLPGLLKAVDLHGEHWMAKYNFFLLLKALFTCESLKQGLFPVFKRVLSESLLHLEDEVRIIVTDITSYLLPLHLQ